MTQDLNGVNSIMKKLYLPGDARSKNGIMARGRNIYRGTSHQANPKKSRKQRLMAEAQRRIRK